MCEIRQVQLASRKNTDTNCNISSCPTAPGPLWALGSRAGTWHPVPAGHLPACAAQPGEPRASPPPCLVPARLQQRPAPPSQQKDLRKPHPELCQQTPSAFQLFPAPDFGKLSQGGSSSHLWSCGNVSFNACTSLRGAPTPDHTCPPLSSPGKAGKAQGPAWQGHTQRSQAARGRGTGQRVSTHSEKETLFYCLIWERGETPGEAPSPALAQSPLQQTPARG